MKKLINDPRALVREMLEGVVLSTEGLALLDDENVVISAHIAADPAERPVALLSGGGSGHEPAHAGYVGPGMLTAAIVGDVFTSPSTDAVLAAIRAVAGPAGALLIVKNYTGDRLNFGLAAELARRDGIPVEIAVVADDVALSGTVPRERRRGIAGTVLVHKIAGAAAAAGRPLADVAAIARATADAVATMGVGLGSCIVPAAGKPGFELGPDEIEYGLGIHGEKGVRRGAMASADEIVGTVLDTILSEVRLVGSKDVAVLINGLGGTPPMELAIVARKALQLLRQSGLRPVRAYTGNYMTALEMPGISLSVLPLDAERLSFLDAPTSASAWTSTGRIPTELVVAPSRKSAPRAGDAAPGPLSPRLKSALHAVADALEAAEAELTDLDSKTGDGDLGASMARAAEAAMALPEQSYSSPSRLLADLGDALRRAIGGSSGPFYATALLRAAAELDGTAEPTSAQWHGAFSAAVTAIGDLGGARPGDRTMLDALDPAVTAWRDYDFSAAPGAAEAGAAATAQMHPRLGRASYLGERALGTPDGGAVAVAIWLRALASQLV
jgi:ATP-dependent dihydroxyacetone kinase